ncbi:TetR/AcrR family transcriptional regulator [Variovorax sp. ZT4R33]|uniref:TetR/AcrR family transcriptional regulator n=1 Tax=Variovorax sp. ZT4R33 TaxID=3443743 RepID=UPI003F4709E1
MHTEDMPEIPLPKVRRTQASRSSETRQRLMDTAIELIGERSFQAATVSEIAKRAGVTTGAVQHHFPSKADLVLSLIDHILEAPIEGGGVWPSPTMPLPERAQAFVTALWRRSYAPPRFLVAWTVYFGCSDDPVVMQHVAAHRRDLGARLDAQFELAFPEIAHPARRETMLHTVLSCVRGLGMQRLFGSTRADEEAQLSLIASLIAR